MPQAKNTVAALVLNFKNKKVIRERSRGKNAVRKAELDQLLLRGERQRPRANRTRKKQEKRPFFYLC